MLKSPTNHGSFPNQTVKKYLEMSQYEEFRSRGIVAADSCRMIRQSKAFTLRVEKKRSLFWLHWE